MDIRAEVITTDGRRYSVSPQNGTDFSLKELQFIVGGYIEIVRFAGGQIMVCNEEGKLIGLPPNPCASILVQIEGINDVIHGNVLICDINMVK